MNRFLSALRSPALHPWLIVIPAVILRLWNLNTSPLWYDEAFTRLLAGLPFDRMMTAIMGDVHPPLYYLAVRGWETLPLGLRGFSALCSIYTLWLFWDLAREFDLPRLARLVALALLAFHPVEIYYAQEARMYALLQMLVLWQLLALVRRFWVGYAIATLLVLYTHNYGLIYTAVILGVGLLKEIARPRAVYRAGIDGELTGTEIPALLASTIIPGLFWLPWGFVLINQVQTISGHYWIEPLTIGSALLAVKQILAGLIIPDQFELLSICSLTAGLILLTWHGLKTKRIALLALAWGPLVLALALSLIQPVLLHRGLIGMLPPLALLAGSALERAGRRGRLVGLALILPLAAGLVMLIGVNQIGMLKPQSFYHQPVTTFPVIHLTDATMVLSSGAGNYRLESSCPDEAGALSPLTRQALAWQKVTLADLPDEYYLQATLYPLSTACHELVMRELTSSAKLIYRHDEPLGMYGMWLHEN